MLPERHPLIYRILKIPLRLLRFFIPILRKGQLKVREIKVRNIYNSWAQTNQNKCYVSKQLKYQPLVSVVTPVFNPIQSQFLEMVYSVANQHYDNWELILGNGSSSSDSRKFTKDSELIDKRIKVVDIAENRGISGNTNLAIAEASGEYIAFFDHDDVLHPCALHSMVEAMQTETPPDILYTDEDKVTDDGSRYFNPHIKSDWSIDTLRNVNYITHFVAAKRQLVSKLGGLRPETDGAQDYDFMLRAADTSPSVKHVQRILYHWRSTAGSTADQISSKQYVFKSASKAIKDHISKNNLEASVKPIVGKPSYYKVTYNPIDFSILIGEVILDRQAAAAAWIEKLLKSGAENKHQPQIIAGNWYEKFLNSDDKNSNIKVVSEQGDFWPKAAELANSKISVCFKVAAIPFEIAGLAELAAAAQDPIHEVVAPPLLTESRIIIDNGYVDNDGFLRKLFEGEKFENNTWFGDTDWVRNVDDIGLGVIALPTNRLRENLKKGRSFQDSTTWRQFSKQSKKDDSKLVVWGHTPFKYLDNLNPKLFVSYQNLPSIRFVPTMNIHIDDWVKNYLADYE